MINHVAEPWTEDITEDDLVLVSQRFVSKDFCVRKFSEYVSGHKQFSPYTLDFEYIVVEVNSRDEREQEESPSLINLTIPRGLRLLTTND
jgi:hypothetical protein